MNDSYARHEYQDGEKTDKIAGIVYTVTGAKSYDQFDILVKETQPIITSEQLEELKEKDEKLLVTFDNAIVKPYYNERMKSIQDSIKADSIHIVPKKQ